MATTDPGLPAIPSPQNVTVPEFTPPMQPLNTQQFLDFNQQLFNQQQGFANDVYAQYYQAIDKYGADWINQALSLDKQFMPQYAALYTGLLDTANPQFNPIYNQLGERIQQGLEAGYELGPDLSREVEQSIRAAQTARGNIVGAAPTAQEAFGMGSAALAMYNTRLGQAQNFLNSKQPTDMWGAIQGTSKYGIWDQGLMSQAAAQQLNPAIAPNVFGTVQGGINAYNATSAAAYGSYVQGLIGAAEINNQSAFDAYSAQFDQFLYRQSVNQGLYSTPQLGSGGGGGLGMAGAAIGGIGSGVATGLGLSALGIGTSGAVAGGIGAAASAAVAAICWVARKALPERWREFRAWLFTQAPDWFRRKYIIGGRRLADSLTADQTKLIREIMIRVLA